MKVYHEYDYEYKGKHDPTRDMCMATVTGFEFRDGLIRLKKKNENNMKGVARIRVEEDETKRIHMVSLRDFYRLYSRVRVFN